MRIKQLRIANYRSIQSLEWDLDASLICLVGPCDSGKSTILAAIEKVLSPRWNEVFNDDDFPDGNPKKGPIVIEVSIGDLPSELLSDQFFGQWIRDLDGVEHDEPTDPAKAVVTLRLDVGESLEPSWTLMNDRQPEPRRISNRERQKFKMLRLGESDTRHLTWARGSALAVLGSGQDEVTASLSEATRAARNSVRPAKLKELSKVAHRTQGLLGAMGIRTHKLEPHLDSSGTWGLLALHDGDVPLRNAGTGTVRLAVLALQLEVAKDGGITLIDEVELGLDPHRTRRLLTVLRGAAKTGTVIVSSHSPVVAQDLGVDHIRVVRDGTAHSVRTPDSRLAVFVRFLPEALLSQGVVVCEGPTECGFCVGLGDVWAESGQPLALGGTSVADAAGRTNVGARAVPLKELGYRVAVLADQDEPLDVSPADLKTKGIKTFLWTKKRCIEQVLFDELDDATTVQLLQLAKKYDVKAKIDGQLSGAGVPLPQDWATNPSSWLSSANRQVVGKLAKSGKGWFKNPYVAREVGSLVARNADNASPYLQKELAALKKWATDVR